MTSIKGYRTLTVGESLYNGLKLEALKQHRSIASLTELILMKAGIKELSEQKFKEQIKKLELIA